MLAGILVYKDSERGDLVYDVLGRDSFNDLKLQLKVNGDCDFSSWRYKMDLFDMNDLGVVPEEYLSLYDVDRSVRRLDIKKTNKYKTTITNKSFSTQIAALVRYVQIAGKKMYNQQVTDEFSATRVVDIITLKTNTKIGTVVYNMGIITNLVCENKYLKLELKTVPDSDLENSGFKELKDGGFRELKEKDRFGRKLYSTPISIVGFKLSEEVLGFPYIPEIAKELGTNAGVFGLYQTIEEVIANNPGKNTRWILDQDYIIVNDSNLEETIALFNNHDGLIAYDTETSGLSINFKSRTNESDQLVGVVLSRKSGEGFYFPLQHKQFANLCNGDHFYFMDKYMRPILENKKIICHNLKFDWKVSYIYDINVNCVYDTLLALGVTKRYEEDSYELGLKALIKNIFGRDSLELSDFIMGGSFGDSDISFWDLSYELVRQYAPADTDNTFALYEFIESEGILNKYNAKKVFEIEITFAKAVAYSEFYGYHIDVDKIPELREKILGSMSHCKEEMFKIAGIEFNPNSPAQLSTIMYDKLGVEQVDDRLSTDKDTLKILAGKENLDGSPKYPFVKLLKTYRDNEGIYKNFLKKLHEFSTNDGYIFPDVLQLGTNTGRLSVKNPNYQSYNDTVKHYVVPRPDFMHFDSDFSQIEQRVLTSYTCIMFPNEPPLSLLSDFDDPDMDYHQYQAARMFNVPYAAVSKEMRQQSKGINFGLPYGMGDVSLGARIFGERTNENTKKAAELRKKFFQGQELIERFFEKVRSEGVKDGFTRTQWGRRRYYHKGVFSVNEIRRQAGNHVIQGTSADIYKKAVNNLFNRVCKEGWLGKVLFNGFIHDEVLLEVHKSINPYYFFKAWREEFEVRPANYCRLYAGAGVGCCWYDAKKLDLPPMFIQEIIDKYNEDMEWDENFDTFFADIKTSFKEHKTRRISDYIMSEKSQGDIIKPAIGALLSDEMSIILKDISYDSSKIDEYNCILESNHLNLLVDGVSKPNSVKGLQDQLRVFCLYNGFDYSKIDIKSPDDIVINQYTSDYDFEEDEDVVDISVNKEELLQLGLITNGVIIDHEARSIHLAELWFNSDSGFIQGTKQFIDKSLIVAGNDGGYKIVYYKDLKDTNPVGTEISGFIVPFDNASILMHYYKEMISKQFAKILR